MSKDTTKTIAKEDIEVGREYESFEYAQERLSRIFKELLEEKSAKEKRYKAVKKRTEVINLQK